MQGRSLTEPVRTLVERGAAPDRIVLLQRGLDAIQTLQTQRAPRRQLPSTSGITTSER